MTATVENTGKTDGKEVVQVYVKAPQGCLLYTSSVRNSDHAKGAGGVFLHYEIFLDLLFAENLLLNYTTIQA